MLQPKSETLARAQQRIGTVLRGEYRLDGVLGVGEMVAVYTATHRNKKRVAVKMLHPELSMCPEIRVRFLREGYAANSVEHPGAVAVLDDDVDESGVAFLVTEFLDGESVDELCARSGDRLPLPVAVSIGHRVLEVLAAAHAQGVVHREVKPSNLFLTRRGEVKLLDFGVARVRDVMSSQAVQTRSMAAHGNMAPEQALGRVDDVDALTDVWAVGAMVFSLASGRRVHPADTTQETMVLSATRAAPSLQSVVHDAPPAVVQAVDRALAFDKAGRWPSALAMREALREASVAAFGGLAPLPALPVQVDLAPPPRATPRASDSGGALEVPSVSGPARSRLALPLVAVAVAALAVGVIALADRRPSPRSPSSLASEHTTAAPPQARALPPAASIPELPVPDALSPSISDAKTTSNREPPPRPARSSTSAPGPVPSPRVGSRASPVPSAVPR
jgi:serine/threonine-protein kinase